MQEETTDEKKKPAHSNMMHIPAKTWYDAVTNQEKNWFLCIFLCILNM